MIEFQIKVMNEKYQEIWKMDTFLEKFEHYHNLMAFNGFDRETYEKNTNENEKRLGTEDTKNVEWHRGEYGHSYFINDEHLQHFKDNCLFLNDIPKEHHKKEVDYLLRVFSQYSSFYREYDMTYSKLFDEDDNKRTINMSNKLKSDIKKAENFRDSIQGEQLTADGITNHVEMYKYFKDKKQLSALSDFSILVSTLSIYIEDLKTKSFKVRSIQDYENYFKKPPISDLTNHLKELATKYNIKDTTSSIKQFSQYLNTPNY